MTRALLLDVMGTLVHDPFYVEVPRHFGMTLEELVRVVHPTSWIDFERGAIDERTYARAFYRDAARVLDDLDGLKGAMASAFRLLEGMQDLLDELKARAVPMHALSNYSPWFSLIEERLTLSRWVEWSFVSCNTGVRKPDAEAYLGAARALGLAPGDCLFVDDRAINCAAAEELGMPAVHFSDARALRAALVARRLLP